MLGGRIVALADLTPPWATATRSTLVRAGGEEFVLQRGPRRSIAHRARLTADLHVRAPWLPLAEVVGAEIAGPSPFLITRRVSGTSGRELMNDDQGAVLLGAAMGRLAREVAAVPVAGLRLSRTWSGAEQLARAATGWLERAAPLLTQIEVGCLRAVIDGLPERVPDLRPVLAHGDFVPVNVIVRDGRMAALLDVERARLAHPLCDSAWWWSIVGHHHPERLPAASSAFFRAAGLATGGTLADEMRVSITTLGTLQLLEMVATSRSAPATRRWTGMLRQSLGNFPDCEPRHSGHNLSRVGVEVGPGIGGHHRFPEAPPRR